MENRDLVEQIERHTERGNRLVDEIREEMRLSREEAGRSREAHERHAALYADLRDFIREQILRIDRFTRDQVSEMRAIGDAIRASTAELRAMRDEIGDLRDENRAQTRALLRLLDRLEPGGSGAAA